ncbi:hypothetical protein N7541_000037 [Penicillium brevicompactum]|uniref:Uncharacterized protein n=1 Tax=Penicillium brevicompactum TaxID=5074 RepID=A0A9W9RTT7_PENBR|nr:hypothetical protein N7541_000037 [Penicillium brevicompactum]
MGVRRPIALYQKCGKVITHPSSTLNGSKSLKAHLNNRACKAAAQNKSTQQHIKQSLELASAHTPTRKGFSQQRFEHAQVKFIANSQLPFQILEHQDFQDLIAEAQLTQQTLTLLTPMTTRHRLHSIVQTEQQKLLSSLPTGAKLSIALDCWTSPFQQAFIAITGYLDYHKILLGFIPIHGQHTGAHLAEILLEVLQEHQIIDRVIAITTDNASNNKTMVDSLCESIQRVDLPLSTEIIRVPCLAHVIQLSLKDLLGLMKVNPKNDKTATVWSEENGNALQQAKRQKGIIYTLAKVCAFTIFINASL